MKIERRTFLAASSGAVLGSLGFDLRGAAARADAAVVSRGTLTTTVCPYCAVGCGAIVTASAGKVLYADGDPDHPINAGSLCSKGMAMSQIATSERRLTKVKYRAPGSSRWEEKDWDWAIGRIAQRIKQTRDATLVARDAQGRTVNRTEGIVCLGGGSLENEVCYAYGKLARALGIVYLEHQARVCHSPTVSALAATFGRGAMTNHWIDLANADCILIIGANAAANYPMAFKWITKARQRGATLISVDPRFTSTSATADLYAPLRPGTDIAFMGGLIRYALEKGLVRKDYLVAHTNAAFLVDPQFAFDAGRFGPIDGGRYTREHWGFQRDAAGRIKTDPTLSDPHCVFQLLAKHYARYTPEMVARVCGTLPETQRQVADAFCATCRPDRSGTILYAVGTTQHTTGTQNIRAYAVLQLLLSNIGVAGGGINALRGESNVQGSCDHGLLFDLLPGYLKSPRAEDTSLAAYLEAVTPAAADPQSANWWRHAPKYVVSLLKAYWGEHATKENQFGYGWLPKRDGDASYLAAFEAMHAGRIRGLFILGQNPAVSNPDAGRAREALEKLDWMVAADLFETETAAFWKRPGTRPADVKTEVFLLPVAAVMETEGSATNSGRWVQWRYAAVRPRGDAHSDLWVLDRLCKELKRLYAAGGVLPEPIVKLQWDCGAGPEPNSHAVAREINGRFLADCEAPELGRTFKRGEPVPAFTLLRDDGTTSCGNWLYAGSYTAEGNQTARRGLADPGQDPLGLQPGWAWSWPANRRILYNRAGCDARGKPWSPGKAPVAYDWAAGRWTGDVPDGGWPPPEKADGSTNPQGRHAFLMLPEGRARLFAPGLVDGPLPEHYEPLEGPVPNALSPQQHNPVVALSPHERLGSPQQYPIVATTVRVSEHWQTGSMTRNLPWLVELVPDAFVEMSKELAAVKGVKHGDKVIVRSARGAITLYALVTGRLRALDLGGRKVEQVALIWHFGYEGLAQGASANLLTPSVADANAQTPEYKAFLCDVEKAPVEEKKRSPRV